MDLLLRLGITAYLYIFNTVMNNQRCGVHKLILSSKQMLLLGDPLSNCKPINSQVVKQTPYSCYGCIQAFVEIR